MLLILRIKTFSILFIFKYVTYSQVLPLVCDRSVHLSLHRVRQLREASRRRQFYGQPLHYSALREKCGYITFLNGKCILNKTTGGAKYRSTATHASMNGGKYLSS